MNYLKKRQASQLSAGYIAYKLGLTLADYRLVERGIRGISGDKIEIFSKLVNSADTYRFEELELKEQAKAWYETVDLERLIEAYGYTRPKLAQTMGVSTTKVWDYCKKHPKRISDTGKLEFYLFFRDENNRYYPKNENKIITNNVADTYTQKLLSEREIERNMEEQVSFERTSKEPNLETQIKDIRKKLEIAMAINEDLRAQLKASNEAYNSIINKNKILEIRCSAYEDALMKGVEK